jgi:hypothetical protein
VKNYISSSKIPYLLYFFILGLLLVFFEFTYQTDSRGHPLKPFESFYNINDFKFYYEFSSDIIENLYLHNIEFKPGPLFPYLIAIFLRPFNTTVYVIFLFTFLAFFYLIFLGLLEKVKIKQD